VPVLHVLVVIVPLGLAAAVSPVMVTEQAVLLAGPNGRRAAWLFAAGTAAVVAAFITVVLLLGRSVSLPEAPSLDASLDLVVGGVLVALAVLLRLWHTHHAKKKQRPRRELSPAAAFTFGIVAMATDVTSLALVLPAAKEIAAGALEVWERAVAGGLLVVLACLSAWAPVALASVAPRAATRLLDALQRMIDRHGRTLVVVLLAGAGVIFLVRGVLRLAGL
jgi:threonine/homoserine/homoserine lactone efflux protein